MCFSSISTKPCTICSVLSSGRYGLVLRALHESRELAIKLVQKKSRNDLEARLLRYSALEHGNLVKILHLVVNEVNGISEVTGYAMELLPKDAMLPETAYYRNIITPIRLYNWIIQLADAIRFLHENKYIHGDVSLRKILVSEDLSTVKLAFPLKDVEEQEEQRKIEGNNEAPQKNTEKYDVYCLIKVYYSLEHRKEAPEKLDPEELGVEVSPIFKSIVEEYCNGILKTAERIYEKLVNRKNELPDANIKQIKSKNIQYSSSVTSNREYVTFRATIKNDKRNMPYVAKIYSSRGQLKPTRREVANLYKLNHDCIQKIEYLIMNDSEDEIQGIILEYMPHGNVYGERYYDDVDILKPEFIITWFIELARALTFCHEKNIVHRNVRPTKMLLTEDYKHIKLTDFSTSRIADENMTSNVGVDPFRAPEAIDNTHFKENSKGLDVWSYGMSLYTCCNQDRILPFQYEFDAQPKLRNRRKLWKEYIMENKNRPAIKLYDTFKETSTVIICGIIKACWKAEPTERPSMEEVLKYLEKESTVELSMKIIPNFLNEEPTEQSFTKQVLNYLNVWSTVISLMEHILDYLQGNMVKIYIMKELLRRIKIEFIESPLKKHVLNYQEEESTEQSLVEQILDCLELESTERSSMKQALNFLNFLNNPNEELTERSFMEQVLDNPKKNPTESASTKQVRNHLGKGDNHDYKFNVYTEIF